MTADGRRETGVGSATPADALRHSAEEGEDGRVAAFMAVSVPLLVIDKNNRILYANRAAAMMAGGAADALNGSSVWQVLHGAAGQRHDAMPRSLSGS